MVADSQLTDCFSNAVEKIFPRHRLPISDYWAFRAQNVLILWI